ncbi:MAG TPA: tRNA pseudouridine(55) synthase TruB [Steroidobacteraceae bacterium]|jgi:tRNA pseudouridine55 synthase|nr:tRNA pseudouridine(55) synthase TruB [Steroidobacteraceae bacterium]
MKHPAERISGILLLDKPEGLSSNAALQRTRRALGADKAGHVGSLDPLATGMLPVCLGEATKVAGELVGGRKRYRFAVRLGAATATGDREGDIIERAPIPDLGRASIESVLRGFQGVQAQVPPMYSALKRDGRPLYQLARAGLEVERAPRTIELGELILQGLEPDTLDLEVLCTKGTYIRVLAADIARALGSCGHVVRLRRLSVEPFSCDAMITLQAVEAECLAGRRPPLIPADEALADLPRIALAAEAAARIACGQSVRAANSSALGRVRLYDDRGRFLGLGEADGGGGVRPKRLFSAA